LKTMSTRANIEFYDDWGKWDNKRRKEDWHLGARLYHHSDGYPSFMYRKIERFLQKVKKILTREKRPYWWDSERVSALFVSLGRGKYGVPEENPSEPDEDYKKYGGNYIPRFQPSQEIHGDIEYLYRIKLKDEGLGTKLGKKDDRDYRIEVYKPRHNKKTYEIAGFRKLSDTQLEAELKEK